MLNSYGFEGTATLTNCTITDNSTAEAGGGVYTGNTGTLTDCTISGNSAGNQAGGGVYIGSHGTAKLTDCAISGNSAKFGGGVGNNTGAATLTNCTISGNSAASTGGGVYNDGTVTLTNCTISGNSASVAGGGVYNAGTATLTNCTISGNSTPFAGGGLSNDGTATLTGTIVAGNLIDGDASDIGGSGASAVTGSHNLIGTGGSGGIVNDSQGNIVLTSLTNLGLAPLGNNGGPTETMALLPGSAAIGKGIATDYPGTITPITTDQRGMPLDIPPDIGAYQLQPTSTPTPTPTPAPTPTLTTITGEQAFFLRKTNKHGKPVGKSVLSGYRFEFSNALNAMSATNTANYQIDNIITKPGHKNKKGVSILQPITSFSVSYSADTVTIQFTAPQKFKTGGQVTVESGVTDSMDDELTGTTMFTISKGGRGITPT